MTQARQSRKFGAEITRPRRALLCLDPVSICQIPRKGSPLRTIGPKRSSCDGAVISSSGLVPAVTSPAFDTPCSHEGCTMSGISSPGGLGRSISRTRSIAVPTAPSFSMSIRRTTRCPRRTTPIESYPWRCAWWWRIAYPITQPVGTCGGITGCSSPSPPSKTGWRPGGKKAIRQMDAEYLNWALADFSGYIALDELYDGPVLCLVPRR